VIGLANYVFVVCTIGGFIAWFVGIFPFFRFWAELIRARRAGEISARQAWFEIPLRWPFTKNILPRAESDRQKFLWSAGAFVAFIGLGLTIAAVFSPPHN
jgi:hypothetical protein